MRRTKIVATLGPSIQTYESVQSLVAAGMDVARLNFSHGDHATHRRWFDWVRRAADEAGRNVAVLQDIQGPKLRVGRFPDGSIDLQQGELVSLVAGSGLGTENRIEVDYPYLTEDVEVGDTILLSDGLIVLEVTGTDPDSLTALVRVGVVVVMGVSSF